jgi:hypothetical protein
MATVNRHLRKSYYSGVKLTPAATANYLYRAGFRGDALWQMTAIAGRESGYDPGAHGSERPRAELSGDRGLFQINYVWDKKLMAAGVIKSRADLMDPMKNARAAYYLYQQSGNKLSPWNAAGGRWNASGTPLHGTDRFQKAAKEAAWAAASTKGNAGPKGPSWASVGGSSPAPTSSSSSSSTSSTSSSTAPAANPAAQSALTSMLARYGVSYPNAPAPTPAMLAFMRGLGMTLDSAEDATRQNNLRLNERAVQGREEITRQSERSKVRMAGDLAQRGVLRSGETNNRIGRHEEDVAKRTGDVEQGLAEGIERNEQAYNVTKDHLRQTALDRTLNSETEQAQQRAASAAQERAWKQQQDAAELAYKRQREAQNAAYAAQEAAYRRYAV